MADITKALLESGVVQEDIQTSRFSLQPFYRRRSHATESRRAGWSRSHQRRSTRPAGRDVRRKAEVYAHASGIQLGRVELWICPTRSDAVTGGISHNPSVSAHH